MTKEKALTSFELYDGCRSFFALRTISDVTN